MSHRDTESLLVIRLSALGDVIHTIPAVVALKNALPQTRIAWAVEPPYRELVDIVAGVEAIPVSLKKWPKSPVRYRGELRASHRAIRRFDTAIDFQGLIKSAALARMSGARVRYGFTPDAVREKPAAWFTNRHVGVDRTRHVVEWNLDLARGVVPELVLPEVDFTRYAQGAPDLESLRGSVVLLPGAGRPEKLWPSAKFAKLAKEIGDRAVAVWGPGEEDLARAIGCRVAPPTSLRQLAYVLQHARVVIGGDTGPLHLAAALGTPTIGLYGPTDPRRNGPYGQLQNCISTFHGSKSMDDVEVDDVLRLCASVV